MAHCGGCGRTLGWKKYRFQKMWRIPGYYCKQCMLGLGADFDKNARITLPTTKCGLCGVDYYFLKRYGRGTERHEYCAVCHEAASSGAVQTDRKLPSQPRQLPVVMMIFAGLGGFMMIAGLLITMMATGDDANVVSILFGATTTALGFVLIRRTLKSRSLLLGKQNSVAV